MRHFTFFKGSKLNIGSFIKVLSLVLGHFYFLYKAKLNLP